ncbi:MAG: ECF-type sigma factor, partial [Acidobacteriota bacterium]
MGDDLAALIEGVREGDDAAFDGLMVAVYQELRRAAQDLVGGERSDLTLAATDIVHEAFIRLSKHRSGWENQRHFFGSAASAMRRILIDHARRK